MAAEGILTALQAALSGLGGGIEGAAQYREMERRRQKEEEATRRQTRLDEAAARRQTLLDEAAFREEQRELKDSGFISADRLPSMTMPGATPLPSMEPTMRQTVGGKEYVYIPSIAQAEKHRGDVMAKSLARAERMRDKAEADKQLDADIAAARKGGRNSDAAFRLAARNKPVYDAMYPEPERKDQLTAYQKLQQAQEVDETEAIFSTTGLDPARAKAMSSAFKALRKAYPNRPARELIFMAVKAAASVPATPTPKGGGRFNPLPGFAPIPPAAPVKPDATQTTVTRDELDDVYDRSINKKG